MLRNIFLLLPSKQICIFMCRNTQAHLAFEGCNLMLGYAIDGVTKMSVMVKESFSFYGQLENE